MKRSFLPRSLAAGGVAAYVLAFCALQAPVTAQQNQQAITTQVVSSTASAGTSSTLGLDGKYSNCALTAAVSTGTATVTVYGNTQQGQYGPSAPAVANSNFGTGGAVTVNSATFVVTSGNFANTPVGAYFLWSGNSGTLTAWLTCTAASAGGAAQAISSLPPVTISSIPPITCASPNCVVNTPAPATTVSPGLMIGVTNVCPSTAPAAINGAYTCTNDSTGRLQVSTPVPYATAVSPAPAGVLAHGYNAGGAAAPIVCTHQVTVSLATTQPTATLLVASASGKIIYVCAVQGYASTAGSWGLYSSAANTCSSSTGILVGAASVTAGAVMIMGTGVGVVAQTGSGLALCFQNAGTTAAVAGMTIQYEQFLHSLTPEQIEAFCSVPKRCLLYGLAKKLNGLMDTATDPLIP